MGKHALALVMVSALGALALPAAPAGAQQAPPAPSQPAPTQPGQPAPGQPAPGQPAPGQPAPPAQPAIPAVPQAPLLPPASLTLGDALTTALRNNLQIRQAALSVAIARHQLTEAEAAKALTLGGSASYTQNSVAGGGPLAGTITIPGAGVIGQPFTATGLGGSPSTQWNFALTLRYPLYTGGGLEAQIEIARANVAVAEAQFNSIVQQVVLAARQAYYGVQQAQGTVQAAQRTVDASRENVRVTDARVRVGTSPQFDLLQAQVQLAQSEQALTRAITVQAQAQQSLATVLFLPLGTTATPATPLGLPQPPDAVEPLIAQALQNRPEMAQIRASQAAARAAISLAEAGQKPNVTASGGPVINTVDPTNRATVNFTASIAMTIAILDGGLTEAKVNEAKTRLQSAQVSEDQTKQQIELDVRNAFLNLRDAADSLRSALAQQASAREALRIANVRFQAGVGLQLEVVTAVQNLASADNNVLQAQYQYNLALAQLDRAVGVQVKL